MVFLIVVCFKTYPAAVQWANYLSKYEINRWKYIFILTDFQNEVWQIFEFLSRPKVYLLTAENTY